jgi:hypothetical protein
MVRGAVNFILVGAQWYLKVTLTTTTARGSPELTAYLALF